MTPLLNLLVILLSLAFPILLGGSPYNFSGVGGAALIAISTADEYGMLTFYGEGARHQGRLDGTIAYAVTARDFLKGSVDYLAQQSSYRAIGIPAKWMQQTSYGIAYLRKAELEPLTAWELTGYLSVAHDKNLKKWNSPYQQEDGGVGMMTRRRRLTGAVAYGISGGVVLNPWYGAEVKALLNYDVIDYDALLSPIGTKEGFGVTICSSQKLHDTLMVELEGALRRPYNYARGVVRWQMPWSSMAHEKWSIGLWGVVADGRQRGVPSHTIVGVEIAYWPGDPFFEMPTRAEPLGSCWDLHSCCYAPLVLAIPERRICKMTAEASPQHPEEVKQ